jgi:hypothetical protein
MDLFVQLYYKDHVNLQFVSGTEIKDPEKMLEGLVKKNKSCKNL